MSYNISNSAGNYGKVIDRGAFGIYIRFLIGCFVPDTSKIGVDINKNGKSEDSSRPIYDSHIGGNLTISFQKSGNDYFKCTGY
jgi:hypothetical protein